MKESSVFDLKAQANDLDAKIVVSLERISEVFRVSLWNIGKQFKLSPLQIQLLIFLSFHQSDLCKVSYLAKEFGLAKATISEAIKTLLKKELIRKETESSDTRSYTIHLTETGEKRVREISFFANDIKKAFTNWSEKEKAGFYQNLIKLIGQLQQLELITVQRSCFNCQYLEKTGANHYCSFLKKALTTKQLQIDCNDFLAF